jgi:hypothetical protein
MKTTKIEWTEATWNPTVGCTKVTAGCKNCYAEPMARRLQAIGIKGYENGFDFTILPDRFIQPLTIKKTTKFFVKGTSGNSLLIGEGNMIKCEHETKRIF